MTFAFHPEAEDEFHAAIDYYEQCAPGLGYDFAIEIRAALDNIIHYPKAWPILDEEARRCLVSRFPYGVVYSIEPGGVFVLAVMHLHRHPDYWKHRR